MASFLCGPYAPNVISDSLRVKPQSHNVEVEYQSFTLDPPFDIHLKTYYSSKPLPSTYCY
jgi:hypothetical protein